MKITIQAYWGAKVNPLPGSGKIAPEETLKKYGDIYICDIIIDNELVGSVLWDGKKLSTKPQKEGSRNEKNL